MAGAGAIPFVEAKINQRPVALFSKKRSPDSQEVKDVLKCYGLDKHAYEVMEIDERQDCTQIENYLMTKCLSNRREVPQLFVSRRYIGGAPEIIRMHEAGTLEDVFKDAEIDCNLKK